MTVTGLLNLNEIKQELVVFLRNSDVISKVVRNVTTITDEAVGTGDDVTTDFELDQSTVKNVTNVKLDGVAQSYGTDYTMSYENATISFVTAPANGVEITSTYDYGSSDKIYPDFPRVDLSINSYPRIAVAVTSVSTTEIALGGQDNMSDLLISVYVYVNGMKALDKSVRKIRQAFLEAKSSFYYLKFVTPVTQSPLINEPARGDKIYTRSIEIRAPFNLEAIS